MRRKKITHTWQKLKFKEVVHREVSYPKESLVIYLAREFALHGLLEHRILDL